MSKFKVRDEVIHDGEIKVIEKIEYFKDGKTLGYVLEGNSNGLLIDVIVMENSLELYKSPHQELLDLGFIISDETIYHVSYMFNGLDLTIFKKEKTYQTYVHNDNYNPINLQLAKILVRYLEELE